MPGLLFAAGEAASENGDKVGVVPMPGMFSEKPRIARAMLFAVAIAVVAFQAARAQESSEAMLTYSRGQAVLPAYEGWHPNPDGTIDLWFGYLNQNYREEPDVPLGPANNVAPQPYGPDAGQPTHFLPRNNRWVFSVRVPEDFGDKEVVWTLTSHGKTYRAYATLKPGYLHDDVGMQREYFGEPPLEGNKPPTLQIEGDTRRSVKVGQPSTIVAVSTDDGKDRVVLQGRRTPGDNTLPGAQRLAISSICGNDVRPQTCGEPNQGAGGMFSVKGLRLGCFVYRGAATGVTFDPPQPKMWEDHRGGSPWAVGYILPPVPKDNKWTIQTTFQEPGSYVVRCLAHDGFLQTPQDITFTVTP
jgi:hypothetical protein